MSHWQTALNYTYLVQGGLLLTLPFNFCLATVCASHIRSACNDFGSTDTSVSGHWVLFKTQSFSTVRWMSQYSEYYLEGCVLCHWTSLILRYFTPGSSQSGTHFDVTMMSSCEVSHLDFVIRHLARSKCYRISSGSGGRGGHAARPCENKS